MRAVAALALLTVTACANPRTTPLFEIGQEIPRAGVDELAKDAPAVLLADRRVVRHFITPSGRSVSTGTKVDTYRAIEIRNEAGMAFADVVLAPDAGQMPRAVAAQTVLPNGTAVPVPADAIKELTIAWPGGGNPFRVKVLSFPKVTPGAILEYRYFTWYGGGLREFDQYEPPALPVLSAEHTFQSYGLVVTSYSARRMKCQTLESGSFLAERVVRCRGTRLTPRPWESFQTPNANPDIFSAFVVTRFIVPRGEAQEVFGSWRSSVERLLEQSDANIELPKEALAPHEAAKSKEETISSVWRWVQRDIRNVRRSYRSHGGFRPLDDVYSHRHGDEVDRARLIQAMLQNLGVAAELAIVANEDSADPNGNQVDPSFFSRGDWIVVAGDTYLDPYCRGCAPGELARSHLGRAAVMASKGIVRLPNTNVADVPLSTHDYQLALSPRGLIIEQGVQTIRGASAGQVRWHYFNRPLPPRHLRERIDREYLDGIEGGEVGIAGLDDDEGPIRFHFRGTLLTRSGYVHAGDLLMVPIDAVFPATWMYAFAEKRKQDVAFKSPPGFENTFRFALPEGAKAVERPVPATISSPFGKYELSVSESGGVVSVSERLSMTVREIRVRAYVDFFTFISEVRDARAKKLVLRSLTVKTEDANEG